MLAQLRSVLKIYREGTRLDWRVWGANLLGLIVVTLAYFHAQNAGVGTFAQQIASSGS